MLLYDEIAERLYFIARIQSSSSIDSTSGHGHLSTSLNFKRGELTNQSLRFKLETTRYSRTSGTANATSVLVWDS